MFSFQGASFELLFQETQWSFNRLSTFGTSVNLLIINSEFVIHNLEVVGQNGLEPSTSRLSVVCSSQLSYWPISASLLCLVEISGIEPLTSCLQGRRSPSWAKPPYPSLFLKWWAKMDSNHRPHDYQSCALASWAIGPYWSLLTA